MHAKLLPFGLAYSSLRLALFVNICTLSHPKTDRKDQNVHGKAS